LARKNKPKSNPLSIVAPVARSLTRTLKASPVAALGGGFGRDLSNWLFPGYLAAILLGFLLIWKVGSPAGNSNFVRPLFIAMNAATLSGFSADPGIGALNLAGQWIALLLIIFGSLFTMTVGALAVVRITRLRFSDRDVITAALIVEGAALLVGASLLWEGDRTPFQALFLSASSFGNCGQYIAALPDPSKILVHAVILPLSVLGGLGLPVLMEIWCFLAFHVKISAHASAAIAATAWLYVIGLVLLTAFNLAGHGRPSWSQIKAQLPANSVLAIESRTGGMEIAPVSAMSQPAQWALIVLMMIGANSAGTAGGLKGSTVLELARGARRILRGEPVGRSFAIAFVWLAVYLGLILAAVLLLTYVSGAQPGDNVLFNAVSGLSNVGFTVQPVPDTKGVLFAYCAIMLVGRMAPLMVLWWMAETTADAELAIG